MQIHLSADFRSRNIFYPCYTPHGRLAAVEMNVTFVHETADVTLPQSMLLPQLDATQRAAIMQDQLSLLENNSDFFNKHNVRATICVDSFSVESILNNDLLQHRIRQLPWLELQIDEAYPGLALGENNAELMTLRSIAALSLSHFGAGKIPAKPIYDNLFTRVKIDKKFLQAAAKRASFPAFIHAICSNIDAHCQYIVLPGIDDELLLNKVLAVNPWGLEGAIFPAVDAANLDALVAAPAVLSSCQH